MLILPQPPASCYEQGRYLVCMNPRWPSRCRRSVRARRTGGLRWTAVEKGGNWSLEFHLQFFRLPHARQTVSSCRLLLLLFLLFDSVFISSSYFCRRLRLRCLLSDFILYHFFKHLMMSRKSCQNNIARPSEHKSFGMFGTLHDFLLPHCTLRKFLDKACASISWEIVIKMSIMQVDLLLSGQSLAEEGVTALASNPVFNVAAGGHHPQSTPSTTKARNRPENTTFRLLFFTMLLWLHPHRPQALCTSAAGSPPNGTHLGDKRPMWRGAPKKMIC